MNSILSQQLKLQFLLPEILQLAFFRDLQKSYSIKSCLPQTEQIIGEAAKKGHNLQHHFQQNFFLFSNSVLVKSVTHIYLLFLLVKAAIHMTENARKGFGLSKVNPLFNLLCTAIAIYTFFICCIPGTF